MLQSPCLAVQSLVCLIEGNPPGQGLGLHGEPWESALEPCSHTGTPRLQKEVEGFRNPSTLTIPVLQTGELSTARLCSMFTESESCKMFLNVFEYGLLSVSNTAYRIMTKSRHHQIILYTYQCSRQHQVFLITVFYFYRE